MTALVKNVELKEGEYVTWVGVHAVAWKPEWGRPTEGFTQLDSKEQALYDAAPRLLEALQRIETWSRAYPIKVFPEPDLKKAKKLLEEGGMTLDAISASNMRHVIEGVAEIAREALEGIDDD